MDKSEKRRLKKLGKKIVEERSADLRKALDEANPASIEESDAWIKNYKEITENERWLRKAQPMMHKREWEKKFIVRQDEVPGSTLEQMFKPVTAEDGMLASALYAKHGVMSTPETYIQCIPCETVLPTLPARGWFYWKRCECGNAARLRIFMWFSLMIRDEGKLRFVRLMGKSASRS